MNILAISLSALLLLAACAEKPASEHNLQAARSHGASDVRGFLQLNRDASGKVVVPANCGLWFDGCNTCSKMDEDDNAETAICTQRACMSEQLETPYCKTLHKHSGE